MVNFYDIIKNYDELHGEEQIKKYSFIKEKLNINIFDETIKILDVGHGTGLIKKVFKKNNILGLDNSKNLLKQSNCKSLFYDFNILPLPFKDKSFDYVFCVTAFHHSKNNESLALEFKRLSKKIVVSLLKKSSFFEEQKKILEEVFKECNYSFYDIGIDFVFIVKC